MDIIITFHNGLWLTNPSPAIVAINTSVRWIVRAPGLATRALLWKVHFGQSLPFGEELRTLEVRTEYSTLRQPDEIDRGALMSLGLSENLALTHQGSTQGHVADRPGDYKYDLSVQDANTGEALGDDDPMLYVVSGIQVEPGNWVAF
jgi:hypothetical protein